MGARAGDDVLLRGQAYVAAGVRSPLSLEATGTLPTFSRVYVPLVLRDWE